MSMDNELIKEAIDKFKVEYPDINIIFLSVSGSHLFGTNTKSSDYDLRGCFAYNTKDILLHPNKTSQTIEFKYKDVEITVHEIYKFLHLIDDGNMNFIEEVLSSFSVLTSKEHEKIKEIAEESLTKELFVHVQGMCVHTKKHAEKENYTSPKRDLYIIRELLRGVVLFKTGKFYSNISTLANKYEDKNIISAVEQLIDFKKNGKDVHFTKDIIELISNLEGEMLKAKEFGILRANRRIDVEKKINDLVLFIRRKYK